MRPGVAASIAVLLLGCSEYVPVTVPLHGPPQELGRVRLHTRAQSVELDDAKVSDGVVEGRALGPVRLERGISVKDAKLDILSVRREILDREIEQSNLRGLRTAFGTVGAVVLSAGAAFGSVYLALIFGAAEQ